MRTSPLKAAAKTDDSKKARAAEKAKPEELDDKHLVEAAGGWDRTMYNTYSSENARFRSEDNSKSTS